MSVDLSTPAQNRSQIQLQLFDKKTQQVFGDEIVISLHVVKKRHSSASDGVRKDEKLMKYIELDDSCNLFSMV